MNMPEPNQAMVARVVEAYRKTGKKPVRFRYVSDDDGCCGMGAMYFSASISAELPLYSDMVFKWACAEFGSQYFRGFIAGFDGEPPCFASGSAYFQGYADGAASAAAVLPPPL